MFFGKKGVTNEEVVSKLDSSATIPTPTTTAPPPTNTSIGISPLEFDALKETANIGTGNASIALSNIFNKKVSIGLPVLEITTQGEISNIISAPNEMVVGIYSEIKDGMHGNILTLMPLNSAFEIAGMFIKDKIDSTNLNEKDKLLLEKLGIAIFASYLSSLAKFFEKKVTFATPSIILTYGNSVHEFLSLNLKDNEQLLLIKLVYNIGDSEIKGDLYLLFTMESLNLLLGDIKAKLKI